MSEDKDIVEGYRQQSGKLPFSRPGSGGSRKMSEPRDEDAIESVKGTSGHKHDDLVTGSAIGTRAYPNNFQDILPIFLSARW